MKCCCHHPDNGDGVRPKTSEDLHILKWPSAQETFIGYFSVNSCMLLSGDLLLRPYIKII